MKVKKLIAELEKLSPETEVVLWSWNGEKSIFQDITPTLQSTRFKGFFSLMINKYVRPFEPKIQKVN